MKNFGFNSLHVLHFCTQLWVWIWFSTQTLITHSRRFNVFRDNYSYLFQVVNQKHDLWHLVLQHCFMINFNSGPSISRLMKLSETYVTSKYWMHKIYQRSFYVEWHINRAVLIISPIVEIWHLYLNNIHILFLLTCEWPKLNSVHELHGKFLHVKRLRNKVPRVKRWTNNEPNRSPDLKSQSNSEGRFKHVTSLEKGLMVPGSLCFK